MPGTETDYFAIAKKIVRGRTKTAEEMCSRYAEPRAARGIVLSMVDRIIHTAQTTHRAYHVGDHRQRFECPCVGCADVARLLSSLTVNHRIKAGVGGRA